MKITRRQLRQVIKESLLLKESAEEAFDVLYDYLDSRFGEIITYEELAEILIDESIPVAAIDSAIKRLEGDGQHVGMLIPNDWGDPERKTGWTIHRYEGYSL
tara:strand:- start:54 stop:359 length:306 start_codon:yes stop_codon:yes gene_type:complete